MSILFYYFLKDYFKNFNQKVIQIAAQRREGSMNAVNQTDAKEGHLPPASRRDLMGMQSVRATFRLSRQTIRTITLVAAQLGIRQKSVFDHLLEDAENLAAAATEAGPPDAETGERIQKTFVMSRKTLARLEDVCRTCRAPRDALIERSVRRLTPVIEKEQSRQKQRRAVAGKLRDLLGEYRRLVRTSEALLGEGDPVHERLAAASGTLESACQAVEGIVKRGEDLENFFL